jgi:hypothetical protein
MTNSLPWYRWPIEIDGLRIKNGWIFPWRTVKVITSQDLQPRDHGNAMGMDGNPEAAHRARVQLPNISG